MKISISITPGHQHSESQDVAFFNRHLFTGGFETLPEEPFRCLGVCDGVGGNAGGRTAAAFVASRFTETDFSSMAGSELPRFLQQLNSDLLRHAAFRPWKKSMATTLSCILSCADGFYLVHGGNTRIYALQGAYLKQLTEDHTHRARLLRSGQTEAAEQCPGHVIYCCLGGGNPDYARNIVIRKLDYNPLPELLFLTSDGIHDYLTIDEMENLLCASGTDSEVSRSLSGAAFNAGSPDDMTVLMGRME